MRTIRLFLSAACICRVGSGFARPGVVVVVGVVGGRGESHASAFSSRMTDDGDGDDGTTTTTSSSATTTPIDDGIDRSTTVPPASVATTPLSSSTLAGRVERALLAEFSSTNKIDRVLASWRYLDAGYEHREYVGGGVDDDENDRNDEGTSSSSSKSKRSTSRCYQHAPSYVPGLKAKTWWDDHVDDASWAKILSRSYAAIRDEFVNVALSRPDGLKMAGNNVWAGALTSDAESYGVSCAFIFFIVCACPQILLSSIPPPHLFFFCRVLYFCSPLLFLHVVAGFFLISPTHAHTHIYIYIYLCIYISSSRKAGRPSYF